MKDKGEPEKLKLGQHIDLKDERLGDVFVEVAGIEETPTGIRYKLNLFGKANHLRPKDKMKRGPLSK